MKTISDDIVNEKPKYTNARNNIPASAAAIILNANLLPHILIQRLTIC
jgi:hypothetical protein